MMTYLKLEFYKLKRRRVFLSTTAILLIQAVWVIAATDQYLAKGRMLDYPWESLLMTFASMQVIFFPIAAAVLSSRICDIEHMGNTLKWLETTSETRSRLYLAKFAVSNLLLLLSSLVTFVSLGIYGFFIRSFAEPFPAAAFFTALIGTAIINAALITLFQGISLYFKNQLIVMVAGIIFGFLGIMGSLLPDALRHLILSCYYLDLSPAAMAYPSGEILLTAVPVWPFALALFLGLIIYFTGRYYICKKEF
ncbi:ABC transporter permease [Eubacterium sp. 1001713B170207_170306_E7]|uniref:ABC transporter permease n=1 Tax=Eubacterium sp. 1001713B170207_170306_E7 TaxID=2787097 RepID=UPI0018983C1C|nr:ABC transporter permease [Eubacterium sp. 1001713B170207_170306_E7]